MAAVPLPTGLGALFNLQFEDPGDPIVDGGFDGVYAGITDATRVTEVSGGKLRVWTSDGDLSQSASANDFTRLESIPAGVTQFTLQTRFTNPFPQALADQSFDPAEIPPYAQLGLLVGTNLQTANNMLKLVFGAGTGSIKARVECWSDGSIGFDFTIDEMANDTTIALSDVVNVELMLHFDLTANTVEAEARIYDVNGTLIGGINADELPAGHATFPTQTIPVPIADYITANGALYFGVTSSDYGAMDSFEATWDYLWVTSPQAQPEPVPAPTNAVSGGNGQPKVIRRVNVSESVQTDGKGIPQRIRGIATRGQIVTAGQAVLSRPPLMAGALSQNVTKGSAALRKDFGLAANGVFMSGGSAGVLRIRSVATNSEPAITDGKAKPKPPTEDMAAISYTVTGGETVGRRTVQLAATSASTTDGGAGLHRVTQAFALTTTLSGGTARLTDLWTRTPAPTGTWIRQAQP